MKHWKEPVVFYCVVRPSCCIGLPALSLTKTLYKKTQKTEIQAYHQLSEVFVEMDILRAGFFCVFFLPDNPGVS